MLKILVSFTFLALFLVPIWAQDASQEECKASLKNGAVIGALTETLNPDKKVCAYTAIPYASPPVGALRFQAPQPAKPWDTLNATSFPNWCPQAGSAPEGMQISEDCLYLNVYQPRQKTTAELADSEGLPVMVWYHGGGYTSGSSFTYNPVKLLARGDVILVVAHYRLGMLGFFSTGDGTVPGNNGLKDQAFSLRWVNENIKAFGGNPNKVTVFGQSAGAASVTFQFLSPLNKGLIHGVIAQSATALTSWAVDRNPADSAKLMAKRLDCPTLLNFVMVACLQNVPWEKIIKAQSDYTMEGIHSY